MQSGHFFENLVYFADSLRQAGVPISPVQVQEGGEALLLVDIGDRDQVFHALRGIFIKRYEHLRLFETMFNAFWKSFEKTPRANGQRAPRAPRHDKQAKPLLITYMAQKARESDPETDVSDKTGTFSDAEILQRKDFGFLTPEELQTVKKTIQNMRWKACLRETRRHIPDDRGRKMHMRRVMAAAVKHGGIPVHLAYQDRKIKQRPLVLIADISGSMEKYARLVLQFFYSVVHSMKNVECFVFGTRLTRVTLQLRLKNVDRAIQDAATEVVDWSGGTRIGESLHNFNREWTGRVVRRGAVVVIMSDGWERGDVTQLANEVRYLQGRCHRLIWLNPLMGRDGYAPLVEGMKASLPYIDDFLPVHNLQSLSALADHLTTL